MFHIIFIITIFFLLYKILLLLPDANLFDILPDESVIADDAVNAVWKMKNSVKKNTACEELKNLKWRKIIRDRSDKEKVFTSDVMLSNKIRHLQTPLSVFQVFFPSVFVA